jgi:hypothetical protein
MIGIKSILVFDFVAILQHYSTQVLSKVTCFAIAKSPSRLLGIPGYGKVMALASDWGNLILKLMSNNIGVDQGELLRLQSDLASRSHQAFKGGDLEFPRALEALLKASPERRRLFADGRPFLREGAILIREAVPQHVQEDAHSFVSDKDPRSWKILHIDWDTVVFESFVSDTEKITGNEKLGRMKRSDIIRLDYSWAFALMGDYDRYKVDSILEYLHLRKNVTRLDFFGTIRYRKAIGNDNYDEITGDLVVVLKRDEWGWKSEYRPLHWSEFDSHSLSPIVEIHK